MLYEVITYLLKIKRNIGNVGKDVLRNVTTLRGSVEDVFATEKVFSIKKNKLRITSYNVCYTKLLRVGKVLVN